MSKHPAREALDRADALRRKATNARTAAERMGGSGPLWMDAVTFEINDPDAIAAMRDALTKYAARLDLEADDVEGSVFVRSAQ